MPEQSRQVFLRDYASEIRAQRAVIFVGAGASAGAVPDFFGLLADLARDELDLSLRPTDDLPAVAQFLANRGMGTGRLADQIAKAVGRAKTPSAIHELLPFIPVDTFWTTNYDTLLEAGFHRAGRTYQRRATEASMSVLRDGTDAEIVKMHGCIESSPRGSLTITTSDYEDYVDNHPTVVNRLTHDLTSKSFLFVGYSHRDHNVRYLLAHVRRIMAQRPRTHWWLTRRVSTTDDHDARLQQLFADGLAAYGVQTVYVDEFSEIPRLLESLTIGGRENFVFVTGSRAGQPPPYHEFPYQLGQALALETEAILCDGQSPDGTGRSAVEGFFAASVSSRVELMRRLKFFANPFAVNPRIADEEDAISLFREFRRPLLRACRVAVIFDGGIGTRSESEEAIEQGCAVLPVPTSTDGLGAELLRLPEVARKLDDAYVAAALDLKHSVTDILTQLKRWLT